MNKKHIIILNVSLTKRGLVALLFASLLISCSTKKEDSAKQDSVIQTPSADSEQPQQEAELPPAVEIIITKLETKFKLYENGKVVDFEQSKSFVFDITHCNDSVQYDNVRFNPNDSSFVLTQRLDKRYCETPTVTIKKGSLSMTIQGINHFDSLSFKEGVFYWSTNTKRNKLFEIKTLGESNLNAEHAVWLDSLMGLASATQKTRKKSVQFKAYEIKKADFSKYKANYRSKINPDTSIMKRTDTTFVIKTGESHQTFNKSYKKDDSNFNYYEGLITPLDLFIISSIDGHNEIGSMLLLDKNRERTMWFESPFDYPMESIRISPNNQFLLGFVNDLYTNTWFISILKIVRKDSEVDFTDFAGLYGSTDSKIQELVWINDSSFAIHIKNTTERDDLKNSTYLKISI